MAISKKTKELIKSRTNVIDRAIAHKQQEVNNLQTVVDSKNKRIADLTNEISKLNTERQAIQDDLKAVV